MAAHESTAVDNLQKSIDFVNRELAAAGFPAHLDILTSVGGKDHEAAQIVNCIFTLLQQRQKDVAYREDMHDRLRRLGNDNDDLSETTIRLKARLEQSERELDTLNNKLDTLESTTRTLREKHKVAKEEAKTAQVTLQQSKAQFTHEMRKRERDFVRLREQLQRSMTEKHPKGGSIKIVNALPKATSNLASKKEKKDEDGMYSAVITSYELREKEIISENANLRRCLFELYSELQTQLIRRDDVGGGHLDDVESDKFGGRQEDVQFQMPFDLVRHSVVHKVRSAIEETKEEWGVLRHSQGGGQVPEELVEELERLRRECDEYRDLLQKQNQLLTMSFESQAGGKGGEGSTDTFEMSAELEEQRREIEEQRTQLEEDRRKFTEAAIKLGLEREALQREQDQFVDEQRMTETENLLQNLPKTPA
ncbi:hypothetical protein HK097_002013, partial [Rhizophlyctis rosea]